MLAAFALLLFPAPVADGEVKIRSNDVERTFLLKTPRGYDSSKPTPVVFGFHGWTSNAKQFTAYTRIPEEAAKRGWISVIPQGLGSTPGWNVGWINLTGISPAPKDAELFADILDSLKRTMRIDEKRVYVCGHSNGAFLTNLIASRYGDRVAAFGSVAGTIGLPGKDDIIGIPKPKTKLSGIFVHGDRDATVAYGPEVKALLKGVYALDSARWWAEKLDYRPAGDGEWRGRGGEIRLVTRKGGGHEWGSDTTTTLLDFFASKKR